MDLVKTKTFNLSGNNDTGLLYPGKELHLVGEECWKLEPLQGEEQVSLRHTDPFSFRQEGGGGAVFAICKYKRALCSPPQAAPSGETVYQSLSCWGFTRAWLTSGKGNTQLQPLWPPCGGRECITPARSNHPAHLRKGAPAKFQSRGTGSLGDRDLIRGPENSSPPPPHTPYHQVTKSRL